MWPLVVTRPQVFSAVSSGGSGAGLLLVLTELTGLYAISTILLIRKQLPPKYRCAGRERAEDEALLTCRRHGVQQAGLPAPACTTRGQMRHHVLCVVGFRCHVCCAQADSS